MITPTIATTALDASLRRLQKQETELEAREQSLSTIAGRHERQAVADQIARERTAIGEERTRLDQLRQRIESKAAVETRTA